MDKKILFENFITTYLKKHCSKNCIDIDLHIDLKKLILKEMENATKSVLIPVINVYRENELLVGDSPEERYNYFNEISGQDDFYELIFSAYPIYPIFREKLNLIISQLINNFKKLNWIIYFCGNIL